MKKAIFSIIAASMLLCATGCSEMDQYPHNGVPATNLNESDAELLLTGLYYIIQNKPTVNGYLTGDVIGGDLVRGGATGLTDPKILIADLITPEGGFVSGPWNGYMTALYQVNSLLVSLNKMAPSESVNRMLGTASFFRGLLYYNLVSRYGAVPVITVPTTADVSCATEEEGWEFVISNFQTAIDNCPTFTDKNLVSRQAAQAMMARTLLAVGRKAEAAAMAEKVIGSGFFSLAPFSDIFRGQANKEEIFTFANLMLESSVNLGAQFYTRSATNGGSYSYKPTDAVMNMFDPDDNRKEISVDTQGTNNVINKYSGGEANTDPLIITRLAEMYLISAEGQGVANGLSRLNQLRAFRGLDEVSPSTEEDFITAILDERHHEFLAEGFRWFDLVRTGRLESTLGIDHKYNRIPLPSRELTLNPNLTQNSFWK